MRPISSHASLRSNRMSKIYDWRISSRGWHKCPGRADARALTSRDMPVSRRSGEYIKGSKIGTFQTWFTRVRASIFTSPNSIFMSPGLRSIKNFHSLIYLTIWTSKIFHNKKHLEIFHRSLNHLNISYYTSTVAHTWNATDGRWTAWQWSSWWVGRL